jgi:hypothetical protein
MWFGPRSSRGECTPPAETKTVVAIEFPVEDEQYVLVAVQRVAA